VSRSPIDKDQTRKVRFLNPAYYAENASPDRVKRLRALERAPVRGRGRTSALLISGCDDFESSWDSSFNGRPNGAFTRIALDALRDGKPESYGAWHKLIRASLPSSAHPQKPNLLATASQKKWPIFE